MKKIKLNLLICLLGVISLGFSQNVDLPQMSQRSIISQRLGLSWVTIEYSSPAARGKQIFGSRIPYDKMWGAGDRGNTTIELTHDGLIEGKKINAGKYGMFMIPGEKEFQIVLSKYSRSLSFVHPTEDEIVLRVSVMPKEISHKEWLSYDFIERGGQSLTAALEWGKTQVPFKIEIHKPDEVLIESLRSELKGIAQFRWGSYSDAANYLNARNIYLDQAMKWIDKSLALERNSINLQVKASLLLKKGDSTKAKEILYEAIPLMSNPMVLNRTIYDLIAIGDFKKAIETAKILVKKHPNKWMYVDTLAEAYLKDGNKKEALKHYKLAKSIAPDNQQDNYTKLIAKIQND
ncbi:DUF2911 domain-containing protein [Pontimicrobium aquaticum]|uniref:DUF2911 domain-containing protein n=1 Tax=Pontimicrobium aquaticum TaxID=2565367 RepID=A0A4U0F5U7_9FLAO|nr:DUF2911 domain-containing protein [Pontimicrobium aquaticum]TJY38222.1 DUF2911 domain-containing protein [Pontimicrobium aquaticum]